MKNLLFILFILISSQLAVGQKSNVIELSKPASEVNLYLNGASIHRNLNLKLKQGPNKIVLKKVSRFVEGPSIQVKFDHDISITAIRTKNELVDAHDIFPKIKILEDSVSLINKQIQECTDRIHALQSEVSFLNTNMSIKGSQNNLTIEELSKGADFVYKRMLRINKDISSLQAKIRDYESLRTKQNYQISQFRIQGQTIQASIVIEVMAKKPIQTKMDIQYLVQRAAWKPIYDLKANGKDENVELVYKAKILNNTEVDWNNVKITCSTSDPSRGITLPQMDPWGLHANRKTQGRGDYSRSEGWNFDAGRTNSYVGSADTFQSFNFSVASEVIEVNELSKTFTIDEAQSIKSGRETATIELFESSIQAKFEYFAIPKLDKDVFLTACIGNWEQLHLINGTVNVYYQNAYIGQTQINTRFVEDTLKFSLGRVDQVLVTRTKRVDNSKKRKIGGNSIETLSFEIVAKNNSSSTIDINILDQVPVAQDGNIKVSIKEISKADHTESNGKLEWDLTLKPGESHIITITFEVEYPSHIKLPIRRTRTINCPSF
jgi:uncharacterized protein (TIGR02231 family)